MSKQENSHNSQGFTHLGLIIVALIVIAAVALGGWYVWQQNREDDRQADGTSNTGQNSQDQNEQSEPPEEGRYLVIEEWGVKAPLGDTISGAYYIFRSDDLAEYVELYDAEFDKLENSNGVSCGGDNKYQFYSISRTKPENIAALDEFAGPEYKEFPFTNEYVFGGLRAHQSPPYCANLNRDPEGNFQEDQNILNIAESKEQAFESAFNALQSAN